MTITASAPVPAGNRLIDAETADITAIRRADNAGRFPTNQPYTGRAAVVHLPSAEDVALVERAAAANPAGAHQLADAIRDREAGTRPANCPPWCSEDHRGQVTEHDGFSVGVGHELILLDLSAGDPAWTRDPATARVLVESTTECGEVITEPRVVLTIAEGPKGHYAGSEAVQGWTGTPAEVRALAAALLAAAELVEGGAR